MIVRTVVTELQLYIAYREANGGPPWRSLPPETRSVWRATAANLNAALAEELAQRIAENGAKQ
jgi:acyl-CoA reductase-like NAD-dependent aldehyde dehydrogenase